MRYYLIVATVWIATAILTGAAFAGVTCTTYGGKGPGGWKWSQTTCR